jgi:hypothetical protein
VILAGEPGTAVVAHAVGSLVSRVDLASGAVTRVSLEREVAEHVGVKMMAPEPGERRTPRAVVMRGRLFDQAFAVSRDDGDRVLVPGVEVSPGAEEHPSGYGADSGAPTVAPFVSHVDLAAATRARFEHMNGMGSRCLAPGAPGTTSRRSASWSRARAAPRSPSCA